MSTGEVLIQIPEVRPQIEQMSSMVKEFDAVQHQRQIDGDSGKKRGQPEEKKKQQDLGAELQGATCDQ